MEGEATTSRPASYTAERVDQRREEADPRRYGAIHHRLKQSYTPYYLTILSIIQGVALGNLALVVISGHQHFTCVQWVLTLNSFGVLIIIWNVFNVQSALWVWIPDVRDSAVPFVVGALELYLNQAVAVNLSTWLFALALIGMAGTVGTWYIHWRSSQESENLPLLKRLDGYIRLYVGYLLVGSVIELALAWTSSTTGLDAAAGLPGAQGIAALCVGCLTTVLLAGSLGVFHLLWRQAIAYARLDHQMARANTHVPNTRGHPVGLPAGRSRHPRATGHAWMLARVIPGRRGNLGRDAH
jgi:hypothetical protein